jgi:hypothetical protein
MTPSGIQPEVDAIKAAQQKIATAQKNANVSASKQFTFTKVEAPSCSVAGKQVKDGSSALCFGRYMRIHAFAATGQPASNDARNVWITETEAARKRLRSP